MNETKKLQLGMNLVEGKPNARTYLTRQSTVSLKKYLWLLLNIQLET